MVTSLIGRVSRAAALHRRATAIATAAADVLDATRPAPADQRRQYELADRLRHTAALLAPGWAGASLQDIAPQTPPCESAPPFVRIGIGAPLDDARFPALVPLLGTGHLSVDTDVRDPRVAGLLRAILLRLLAATPAGSLLVRVVESVDQGGSFTDFAPLTDAGLLPPAARDLAGLRAVITEAEQWVAPNSTGQRRHERTLLLMIVALPESVEPVDLERVVALAAAGPGAGLHLVLADWPPPAPASPRAPQSTPPPAPPSTSTPTPVRPSLPHTTALVMRNPYALLGDPPGATFSRPGGEPPTGLNSPVFVDEDPDPQLVDIVCRRLAEQVDARTRLALTDLLPDPGDQLWQEETTAGMSTTVGDANGRPVPLGFTDLAPHWLISGRPGSGKSAFLANVLFGLAARYGPEELIVHLADLADGDSFTAYLQTDRDRSWLPQVRTAGIAADREYVLDLFDHLEAELAHRQELAQNFEAPRFTELRQHARLPRILCVIENFPLLVTDRARSSSTIVNRLASLARSSRGQGVHLILVGDGELGIGTGPQPRDSVLGQFPVRVALPGGGSVLEPTNDSAAGLPLGSAVVNTAGGLGGPRGATRGHERMVRFPDPHADPEFLRGLRRRLWSARSAEAPPPVVFAGYARPVLTNDPQYRAAVAGHTHGPAALLGRAVDLVRSTVSVPLGPAPGRNLAVFGSTADARELLATAVRSVAAHHGPGSAHFVIAPLAHDSADLARDLAAQLAEEHTVQMVDQAGLLAAMEAGGPGYLVVFGLGGTEAANLPLDRLRAVLRDGPAVGLHLLGWWRSVPAFSALLDPESGFEKLAAVAALDVSAAQLVPIVGRGAEQWRPRTDRAILWDGPDEQGKLLVPFGTDRAAAG